jgi:hypothetical protein
MISRRGQVRRRATGPNRTNPLTMGPEGPGLSIGHNISGGELVASWAPGAFVYKTLNQTGSENMAWATCLHCGRTCL